MKNRTWRLALAAAFALIAIPAFSQSSGDSWAMQALTKMKKAGLLKSYPDGLFKEGHPPSRLEIAVAAHTAFTQLRDADQRLRLQGKRIDDALAGAAGNDIKYTTQDLEELKALLGEAALAASGVRDLADSAANLARMASEYEDELEALGVDVAAMRTELVGLEKRVGKLEQDDLPLNMEFDWNLVSHMGHSSDRKFGLTVDGRPTGVGRDNYRPVGLLRDIVVGEELSIGMSGDVGNVWWKSLVSMGNLTGGGGVKEVGSYQSVGGFYNNQGTTLFNTPFREQETDLYFQSLEVGWKGNVARKDANFRVGRINYEGISYAFRRQDTTPYFDNPVWDDHHWYFDGAQIQFPFRNGGKLDVIGGRQSGRKGTDSGAFEGLWPMTVGEVFPADGLGRLDVDTHFGLAYNFHPCRHMRMGANYWLLDGGNAPYFQGEERYNRLEVSAMEGFYDLPCGKTLNFGAAETNYKRDSHTVESADNRAYWVNLPWNHGRARYEVGWRQIDGSYGAPGDWGRLGPFWRPVDHKGYNASLAYRADTDNQLNLEAYRYRGLGGDIDIFAPDENLSGFKFDWSHKVTDTFSFRFGYENLISDRDGDEANFEWTRFGFDHDLGGDTQLSILYELSNASASSDSRWRSFYGDRRRGGFLTFQLGQKQ